MMEKLYLCSIRPKYIACVIFHYTLVCVRRVPLAKVCRANMSVIFKSLVSDFSKSIASFFVDVIRSY